MVVVGKLRYHKIVDVHYVYFRVAFYYIAIAWVVAKSDALSVWRPDGAVAARKPKRQGAVRVHQVYERVGEWGRSAERDAASVRRPNGFPVHQFTIGKPSQVGAVRVH